MKWNIFFPVISLFFGVCSVYSAGNTPLTVKVFVDKTEYLPNSGVNLIISLTNHDDNIVEVGYGREGLSPEVIGKFDMLTVLNGSIFRSLEEKPENASNGVKGYYKYLYAPRDSMPLFLKIEPSQTISWSKRLPIQFNREGIFRFEFKMPKIVAHSISGESEIKIDQVVEIKVIKDAEFSSQNGVGSVDLENGQTGGTDTPVLKWSLVPPRGGSYIVPNTNNGSCRIVLRDESGKVVRDLISRSYGLVSEGRIRNWKNDLTWSLALNFGSLTGFQQKDFFPHPGKYTVEAFYRDYLEKSSEIEQATYMGDVPVFSLNEDMSEGKRWDTFAEMMGPVNAPINGKWIAFSRKFDILISP